MASTQLGRMDVSAVLASLYPASTIVLAMVLLREKATAGQLLGMFLALAAVAMIAG
jgi:drug/metabolite transporter (DMT)-like permease